ncbi:hypothetical protein [Saccharomonospora cyanea]|uniref:Uncharacterized protein n=1 Tax=Saccharomonospora cyanea NA-134 TaxID=882082 RepID=H5XPY7_9PSEU|nr:hypothetical protein [Saccharomonospora cyanea]EHR62212.1 hypothetical protein SaccyDRAFT_3378 [Saccharomonospora cyanea NA-134]
MAVVAIVAFAITAFVAPGFLLSDDESGSNQAAPGGDDSIDFGDSEAATTAGKVA